jgi:hypothetical protein
MGQTVAGVYAVEHGKLRLILKVRKACTYGLMVDKSDPFRGARLDAGTSRDIVLIDNTIIMEG